MTDTKAVALVAKGGAPTAIIPRTIEEAFRLATAFAKGGMLPKGMDTPEAALAAIIAGAEVGLPPFQAISSIAVINGRPTLWGDGLLAVALNAGVSIREWTEGSLEDGTAVAYCEVTRPDTGEVTTRSFSIADAKRAKLWGKSGPWTEYPQRMLPARARAFALRDAAPDLLRGLQVREEVEDMGLVQSTAVTPAEAFSVEAAVEPVEIEIVEVEPEPVEVVEAAVEAVEVVEVEPAPEAEPVEAVADAPAEPEPTPEVVEVEVADAFGPSYEEQAEALPDVPLAADLTNATRAEVLGWAQTFDLTISKCIIKSALDKYWKVAAEAGRLRKLEEVAPERFVELQARAHQIAKACSQAKSAA